MMVPIMEGIRTINSFGMEVVSGIILGLDTDKPETGQNLLEFIEESQIPLLTINLLQALPKTPLWDRLMRENRLIEDEGRESNVDFHLPYEDVVKTWRACMGSAYQPGKLLQRYEYQIRETYPNQLKRPRSRQQASWHNIKLGLTMLRNIFWKVGVLGDYRIEFWKFALRRLARGEIEHFISSILVAHHLIMFARAASVGRQNASNYSIRLREASVPAE
jgi:hopanoid C-2 methylase